MSAEPGFPLTSVAELRDGAHVRVAGTIRAASESVLVSKLGKRECVYWDVRDGLDDAPRELESQAFWLEDASGRVLVRASKLDVDARAQRQQAVLAAVEMDMNDVSRKLRDIKDARQRAMGNEAAQLLREQKHLAKVATLLCAVRAHARGRVHGKGTLASQERWIRENAHLTRGGAGARATQLMVNRWETVLAPGQEIEAEGIARVEPAPPELARGASYRAAATIVVLTDPDAEGVRVRGRGASAPPSEEERRAIEADDEPKRREKRGRRRRSSRRGAGAFVALGGGLVVAVAVLLEYLGR